MQASRLRRFSSSSALLNHGRHMPPQRWDKPDVVLAAVGSAGELTATEPIRTSRLKGPRWGCPPAAP